MASEPDLCVAYERPAYAIQGNMIGRQDHNGPCGSGINEDMAFTLTSMDVGGVAAKYREDEPIPIHDRATRYKGGGETRNDDGCGNGMGIGTPGSPVPTLSTSDHHMVAGYFNRQRCDLFKEQDVASTQSARQYKDATDLICEKKPCLDAYAVDCRNCRENEDISGTLQAKNSCGYSLNYQNPVRVAASCAEHEAGHREVPSSRSIHSGYIVRRLTPTECERLQGFEDGWTAVGNDGKEISDTRRYMMLGNSLAIPCVMFVLGGIAGQIRKMDEKEVKMAA
jgi:DNA (cytosine-5)-methyltransferase 1